MGRRQFDPSPKEARACHRLSKLELRTSWIITRFFPMLSLFVGDQNNTESIEVSFLNKSAMRTQLWELNSYGGSNFFQSIWLIKYTLVLENLMSVFSHKFYDKSNINLRPNLPLYPCYPVNILSEFLKRKVRICGYRNQ